MSNKVLDIIIQAHDKASKDIQRVRSEVDKLNQIGSNMRDVGTNFALMGLGVASGLGLAVKTTMEFEQAIANAGSVMGRSAGDWKDIEQVAREYGKTTTYTATESAGAIQLLAQYGYDLAEAQKHMASTTKLATAQNYDLGLTTDVVVATMKNFEKQGYGSAKIADIFAKASNISSANMDKFRYSLKYTSPVANSLGISLEDMTAQLALLYDAGLPAETAGTALRMAYSRLLSPTKGATEALAKYGITLDQVNPQTNKMADIMDTLTKAGLTTNDAFEVFGVETAPAMLAMMEKGGDALRDYEKQLMSSSGTVEKMYETQMSTFKNQLKLFTSQLQETGIQIGMILLPALTEATKYINGLISKFNEMGEGTKKWVVWGAVGFSALTLVAGGILFFGGAFLTAMASMRLFLTYVKMFGALSGVAKVISYVGMALNTLKALLIMAGKAFLTFGRILLTNPIVLAITLIVGAIYLLYQAWTNNWGGIQEKTATAIAIVKQWFSDLVAKTGELITGMILWFQQLPANLQTFFVGAFETARDWVLGVWQSIRTGIYNFLLGILVDTGSTTEEAKQTLSNIWNSAKLVLEAIWAGIRFAFYDVWVQMYQEVSGIVSQIITNIKGWFQIFSAWISPYLETLKTFFRVAFDFIKNWTVGKVTEMYNNFQTRFNLIKNVAKVVFDFVKNHIKSRIEQARAVLDIALNFMKALASSSMSAIKASFQVHWNTIKTIFSNTIGILKNIVAIFLNLLGGNTKGAMENVKNIFRLAWDSIKTIFSNGIKAALSAISSFFKTAENSGSALMDAFARGIKNAVGKVTGAVEGVLSKARNFFGFSDAKEGPFSNITHSGYATIHAFAKGVQSSKNMLSRAVGGTLGNALSGASVGSLALSGLSGGMIARPQNNEGQGDNIEINITIQGGNADAKEIAQQVMDEINRQLKR